MNQKDFTTVMSPDRFIAELRELNPEIDLKMVDWVCIQVGNKSIEEILLPDEFSVMEKSAYRMKLTNAQSKTFGQYQPVLIFPKPEDYEEGDLPWTLRSSYI